MGIPQVKKIASFVFLIVSATASLSFIFGFHHLQLFATLTGLSPAPIVFTSFRGFDGFAAKYNLEVVSEESSKEFVIDSKIFSKIEGGFNRRIVYGSMFSYGLKFQNEKELKLRNSLFDYSFCKPAVMSPYLKIKNIKSIKLIGRDSNQELKVEHRCH